MKIPEKDVSLHTFEGGSDSDTANELFPANKARRKLNTRSFKNGDVGLESNLLGNLLIPNNVLPTGNNICIGYGKNEEEGKLYIFNYNDQGYHGIYVYDTLTEAITPVLQNLIDTNNNDILKFDPKYLINHVDVVADKLIYWVDGLNKARKFNINKAIDKSDTGYGTVINEDFITAYKQTGIMPPTVEYFTDLSRTSNYLYALQFKFAYRLYYDDGEISNWSDYSAVPLPPNESYLGQNAITYANNGIYVTVETGNRLVTKIEIGVNVINIDWVSCVVLNKDQLSIVDYGVYKYSFYNDGAYTGLDQNKVFRAYSFMPRIPYTQSFVKVAMTYGHADEGFEPVKVNAAVAISFNDFYLPSGTVSQLNSPSIIINLVSTNKSGGLFNTWFTTVTNFVIGNDVKKGNVFTVNVTGGNGPRSFTYTAQLSDSAFTVASAIKQFLRGTASADFDFSNENTDGSGNVSWTFTIEAHEGKNAITFNGNVTPVNYSTLLDNGLSINSIKMGASRKYAIVYDDDDGRTSLAYTQDSLLVRTPFQTEMLLGETTPIGLKQPVHEVSIFHRPPIWAKYWRLVRSTDTSTFIQLLIQQVNTVQVANEDTYLDLVVGSLFTYQKIHPDTILAYTFERGDRLRLIADYSGPNPLPYEPFYETEILNYSIDTEEVVNSNIVTDGSNEVTPGKAVDENYIGKYIVIGDVERLITGIDGSKYVLEYNITLSTPTQPNYKFRDRRGLIRIKKPVGYNVNPLSLVEVYRPQQNNNNQTYQDFFDFQQKFPVSNWGTATRAHIGNDQNQDGTSDATLISTPAKVKVVQGDCYVRNRALPSNNQDPNPQVIIGQICDPNFSDFYASNMYSTGRVYPQDQANGVVKFGSRIRFSNNYIEDTQINGLNDFDNGDRVDYNDAYGTITLTKFRKGILYVFKQLRACWTLVSRKIIKDNSDSNIVATSDKLLNDLEYSEFEGGIGDNGESWFENGTSQYYAAANAGVFIRMAQNGSTPISQVFFYDKVSREILANVSKYRLNIYGCFNREYDEAHWTVQPFIKYLFNNSFIAGDWQTIVNAYPSGTTFAITQQPANATATVVGDLIEITGTSTLGNDYFKFQGTLPDATVTPVMNFCFNVTLPPNRTISYRPKSSCAYCLQSGDTPLADFDYLVLRYVWAEGAGQDLDTFTGFQGTGTDYDGNLLNRTNWVGFNQNPVPPATSGTPPANRIIPQGADHPYLNWGTDNQGTSGVEAILLDLKQFITDIPGSNNPINVKMNAVWYVSRASGNITVGIKTYKGGTMALVGTDFVNTGGDLVDDISYPVNVGAVSASSLIGNSQNIAVMSYNKTTSTATLTLV